MALYVSNPPASFWAYILGVVGFNDVAKVHKTNQAFPYDPDSCPGAAKLIGVTWCVFWEFSERLLVLAGALAQEFMLAHQFRPAAPNS